MKRKKDWKMQVTDKIQILNDIESVRSIVRQWKREGLTVGLVPTMGALHIGHESLIKKAKETCDRVVVSVFVNPIQFGPNEDYDKYPRQLEKDSELCSRNGIDAIFHPTPEIMYPETCGQTLVVPPSGFQKKLCGITRAGHFDGVATVVTKLFNIVQPDTAFFGQKDAQQVIILKKMVRDLNIPVEIITCPIIRDLDGLACSSRNAYLSISAREKALSIHRALFKIRDMFNVGITDVETAVNSAKAHLHGDLAIEYFEVYDALSLEPIKALKNATLIAIAVKIDNVRLIDNIML